MNPTSKNSPPACLRIGGILSTLLLTASSTALQAATYSWDGTTGSYDVNTNWSTDVTPIAADNAQLANGGTIEIGTGVTAPASGFLNNIPVSNGTLAMTGGVLNTNNLQVTGGTGVVNLSGGITTVPTDARIAATNAQFNISGTAEVHFPKVTLGSATGVTGATMTVSGDADVFMDQNGSNRELWIGGNNNGSGVLILKDNASWTFARKDAATDFAIGRGNGSGVVTIQDNATLTYTPGPAVAAPIYVGGAPNFGGVAGTNVANAFHLNGGTVTASGIHKFAAGNGTLNLNGGKIVAADSVASFFAGFTGTGGLNSVNLLAGGLKFDSNGQSVVITNILSGEGDLEKLGAGSLSLSGSSTYTGDTTVTAGELILNAVFLHDDSKLTIADGAQVNIAHGVTDVIGTLQLGTSVITSGTWGSSSSAADNVNDDYFTGAGVIRVGEPVTGRNLTWTRSESNLWGMPPGVPDLNFKDAAETAVAFGENDNATFNDTATEGDDPLVNLVLLSGSVQAGAVTVDATEEYLLDGLGSGLVASASIVKNNTGTLTLGGETSSFTGAVAVNGGVLKMGNNAAFGATSGITIANGAQVDINGKMPGSVHSYTLGGSGPGGTGAIVNSSATAVFSSGGVKNLTLTADSTIGSNAGRFDIGLGGTITGNGHTLTKTGTNDMGFRGDASGTPIHYVINSGTVWAESSANAWGGATGTLTVKTGARVGTFGNLSIATPVTLEDGGTLHNQGAGTGTWNGAVTIQGNVTFDTAGGAMVINGVLGGTANVTKIGANNVTFSASALPGNVGHTGNTTVSAGRLVLGAPALADDSDVIVAATAFLNLGFSGQDTVDTLTLGGVQVGSGVWGSATSGAANTSPMLEGAGTLFVITAGAPNPYGNWALANGVSGATAKTDSDQDGIPNGIEFVIGGDPSGPGSDSSALLPTVSTDATYLNFVFRRTDESTGYSPVVEYGSTLAAPWTPAQGGVDGVIIDEVNDGFGPGIDQVTVRIPRSLASGEKIFARLHVTIP